eukprot:TRINITY_DN20731_c0_g2_i1.p1 TRINITY_DN20731_c0_g2~~TRINITY_DN20731_c0_g2_i1.p1  ORF type:complete len:282 (-),score=19.76 TRINITY_DN20731_c0_g2_i1:412-1257(-)
MIRRPPRSTLSSSSAASDVYKRQSEGNAADSQGFPNGTRRCMDFTVKQTTVTIDGAPLQVSLPSVQMDEATKSDVAKAGAFFALTGVTGVLAVGGAAALEEWHAMARGPIREPSPVERGPRLQPNRSRVRQVSKKPQTRQEKLLAKEMRRARERQLMEQMCSDNANGSGAEPRGRYQPGYSEAGLSPRRTASLDSLMTAARTESPSTEEHGDESPRYQRIQREKMLMEQMADHKRQEQLYDTDVAVRVAPPRGLVPRPRKSSSRASSPLPGAGPTFRRSSF